jgi:hypothetical protein
LSDIKSDANTREWDAMGLEEISVQYGIGLDVLEWMQNHSINDLTHIAEGMDAKGIDLKELWCLINDLRVINDN